MASWSNSKEDKLQKIVKLTKLHVDENIFKEARNAVQNFNSKKEKDIFRRKTKLKANTTNPKNFGRA